MTQHLVFTVDDMFRAFMGEVVSGACFSDDQEREFFQQAADILNMPVEAARRSNIPSVASKEQMTELDSMSQGILTYCLRTARREARLR